MKKQKRYYSLAIQDDVADVYIYGDIVSWPLIESDVSSYNLAKEIEGLEVDVLNVYINSYGGEVAEGLAIYNTLRRHKAKVTTYCDGFACSAASVVFMAGDERIMSNASLLMIHNAWMFTAGNSNELRKQADDLETINSATMQAYLAHVNISEDELKQMMDAESWLSAMDALNMGFATAIVDDPASKQAANQSARKKLVNLVLEHKTASKREGSEPEPKEPSEEPDPQPEKGFFNFMAALAKRIGDD
jgi:ATP-dependent Clp protease protease subunit